MKRIAWTEQARADIRSLDKPTAMRVYQRCTVSWCPARAMSRRFKVMQRNYGYASAITGFSSS